MELRITTQTQLNRALSNQRQQTDQLGVLFEQASSGKRLLNPSDDPLASLAVLTSKAQVQQLDTYLANIQEANTTLGVGASSLQETIGIFSEARRVALDGAQSFNDPDSMNNLALEVDGHISRLLQQSNAQFDGRFIFSGTATQTAPFAVTATDSSGRPLTITYQGAAERSEVAVSQQQNVPTRFTGREVFQQRQRATTVYTGTTGAAPGTGTDSATGQGTLLVAHTATIYAGGSGVAPGTGSVAGDTIIGPAGAHQLNIVDTSGTGAFGTASLDGGGTFNWTSADTNLQVSSSGGDLVFINTTAITPGFSGNVAITANGTMSVDGGATSTAITFAGNQVVAHGTTGAVTNVNSTNIVRTGNHSLSYTGTYDAFQILIALRDDLRNTRNLSPVDQANSISQRLTELDRVSSGMLKAIGEKGTHMQNLQGLEVHVRDIQVETRKVIGNLEDADVTEVITNLQAQQNQLRLTLAASARIFDQSLLDFIS